jgi:hypothetical protein
VEVKEGEVSENEDMDLSGKREKGRMRVLARPS